MERLARGAGCAVGNQYFRKMADDACPWEATRNSKLSVFLSAPVVQSSLCSEVDRKDEMKNVLK